MLPARKLGIKIANKYKRTRMNLDKTAKALKKINRLYELISDIGESTDTERDLLKAYAKDLYNSLASDKEKIDDEISKDLKKLKKEEKRIKKEHKAAVAASVVAPEPVIEKAPAKVEVPPVTEAEVVVPTPELATIPSSSSDSKISASSSAPQAKGFSDEMLGIFEVKEITELSDKLSQTPITDLTKAMGINEKIFTVNELFGGNNDEFNNLMVALNGLSNYDEARVVLMKSAASKYDWDDPAKIKKARNLVKLVQRRFN